jgi:opacity protein-like surface antigen
MKLTTIGLASAFALLSTAAMAQAMTDASSVATQGQAGTAGYGSVVAPSVGSYAWPSVGSTNAVPTWSNTGPAAPLPSAPTVGNASGDTFAPIRVPRR